jgi:tRNA U34 5-carboxymethylaminomethyl modifying enzyme MnmG/GidA
MKIQIQRQDYTAAFDSVRPLTIERKLNTPSVCELWLSLPVNGSLATPARF